MAQDPLNSGLRPAWRLAVAMIIGLALSALILAWPGIVHGQSPPEITHVEATSSKGTFFYSPPLGSSGGSTYFNSLSGEGAGQIVTVKVVVADDNPILFSGDTAFGIAPSTTISTSYGATSTWSVSYTIPSNHGSENNISFIITDGDGFTDEVAISFIKDNTDPVVAVVNVTDPDYDPDGNELNANGNWYRKPLLTGGWSFNATVTENGSGYASGLATWDHQSDDDDDQAIVPALNGGDALSGTFTGVYTNSDGRVLFELVAVDNVGNQGSSSPINVRLDGTPPFAPAISFLPDTDSGGDGFDPAPGYYDDPSIDLTWSVSSDGSGSGVAGYYLDTQSPPGTDFFYTGTAGVVTVTGSYSDTLSRVFITAVDKVGNVGSDWGFIESTDFFLVRVDPPSNGDISIQESTGGQYLYIGDPTQITGGTLYYNNTQSSSFTAIANTAPPFSWGYNTASWKVVFTPGWGESENDEQFSGPFEHTYSIAPLETTDIFTVYFVNRAGNVQSVAIDAVLDTEAPQVNLTDVTDPQYDPDGDELNDTFNWYRTPALGAGWGFTAAVTEIGAGYASGLADWDHQVNNGNDQTIAPNFDGIDTLDGTFAGVQTNSDGSVQVTVVVTDHVSNVGSDDLTIRLDGTPPDIDADLWDEDSAYLTLVGDVLYFNAALPDAQAATVSGTASDASGSGLDNVVYEQKPNLTSDPTTQSTSGNWSSVYSFIPATGAGSGALQVSISDNVGNLATHTYEYVGVSEQPGVAFNDVTLPGYDVSPFDPLDDVGNWYAERDLDAPPGNSSWWFQATITPANNINVPLAGATWDHSAGPPYQRTIQPTPIANSVQGRFENVRGDPSGLVTVTLTITDDLNRVASDTLQIRIDKDGPAISGDGWSESSNFLHVDGSTLFFSHLMGSTSQAATLGGRADDGPNGAGSKSVAFSSPESLGPSIPDPRLPDWSIQYFVSASSTDGSSPVQVTVEDNLSNQSVVTYPYVLDTIPPTAPTNFLITTPPVVQGYYNTRSLDLSWDSTTDNVGGSGLRGYYLGASIPPTDFYPPATTAASVNTAADGMFTFHLGATDNVGNTGLTSTTPITVDTNAPVGWVRATAIDDEDRILVEWGADDPPPGTWVVAFDVQFRVTETGSWQPWIGSTVDTSAYFGPDSPIPVEFETPYFFRVRARDYVGNVGGWSQSIGVPIKLRRLFLPVLLDDTEDFIPFAVFDGFETGAFVGWKTAGVLPTQIVPHPVPLPGGGSYAALLGSPNYGCGNKPTVPVGQALIKARAEIPVPASGKPYLRFNYRVLSYDTVRSSGGEWWDRLEVQVDGETVARYGDPDPGNLRCDNLYDSGWLQGDIDLSGYKGKTVILTFFNENHKDGYWNTYSYLDNIRIAVGP